EKHTISVRWYLKGLEINPTFQPGKTEQVIDPNAQCQSGRKCGPDLNVHLALPLSDSGLGMARVFWDLPANDNGNDPNDQALALTIYFAVEANTSTVTPGKGTPGTGTPTAAGTPARSGTPAPTGTATK